uniref:Ribbon-helix-helix protein, CopG family n=1 Tax=Ignisphaera aggregans TaxID=334771 RepID=A0A7C5UYD2_9CREN
MVNRNRNSYIELNIETTKVISVKLSLDIINELDKMVRKHNFKSRSEFIREALNLYIKLLNMYDRKELRNVIENKLKTV